MLKVIQDRKTVYSKFNWFFHYHVELALEVETLTFYFLGPKRCHAGPRPSFYRQDAVM